MKKTYLDALMSIFTPIPLNNGFYFVDNNGTIDWILSNIFLLGYVLPVCLLYTSEPELETCFEALYGILLLKLQKKEISEETRKAQEAISTLLAMLSNYYICLLYTSYLYSLARSLDSPL